MKRVLVVTQKPFAEKAISQFVAVLNEANYEVDFVENYPDKTPVFEKLANADAVIVRSDEVDKEFLEHAPNLKVIVRAGSGYDNVDLEAASQKGVVVMNTPGQNSNAVAELAIGLIIYGMRNFFSGGSGMELRGKTLGLHGYGYVARNVNHIAKGFGMKTITYTRYSKSQAISEGLVVTDSLEELYAMSDVVSIHVPARGEHIESVGQEVLQHLNKNAIVVNTARKEVINEPELVNFLRMRPDVKYLSDIAPKCVDLFNKHFVGRYYFTPKKIGAQTADANINAGVAAAQQIVAYFEKDDTTFQVNKVK